MRAVNTTDNRPIDMLNEAIKLFHFKAVCINNETSVEGVPLPWEKNRIYGGQLAIYDYFLINSDDGLFSVMPVEEFKKHFRICKLSSQMMALFKEGFFESICPQNK